MSILLLVMTMVAAADGVPVLRLCNICRCSWVTVDCSGQNIVSLKWWDYAEMGTYRSVNLAGSTRVNQRYLNCRYFGASRTRTMNLIGSSVHCSDIDFDGCKVRWVRLSRQRPALCH